VLDAPHLDGDALVFGKGPTFDPRVVHSLDRPTRVYAINQAALALRLAEVEPDLVVCCDIEPMLEIQERVTCSTAPLRRFGVLAAPVYPHENERPMGHPFDYSDLWDTFQRVYLFDMYTAPKFEFNRAPFKPCTTYNAVLEIAAANKARTVYTNGVDGGTVRHAQFKNTHQVNLPNYDAQFDMERELERTRGIRFARLKG
jgi:hypothetical protein